MELQEQEGGGARKPSLSRVNKCFEILGKCFDDAATVVIYNPADEVVPHLGVYQRVMQLIRRELLSKIVQFSGAVIIK